MGGFRFNGCGVTDHFKDIKILGVYNCPNCKKSTEFAVAEANQKIDVFWIPTLTLKSRYAVMCKKCKTGEFCSAEWAGYLMNQDAHSNIIFESEAKAKGWSPVTRSFQCVAPQTQSVSPSAPPQSQNSFNEYFSQSAPAATEQAVSQPGASGGSDAPTFFKCAHCGVTQMREGNFCAYCGKPAPALEPPKQNASSAAGVVICPSCGNRQEAGGKFCFQCGQKLTAEPPRERNCPHCGAKVKDGMLFCMECGTRLK